MLSNPKKRWKFNQSPLFYNFLMGKWDFECTPWGKSPPTNMFGWQRPCYLLQEGYAATFKELMRRRAGRATATGAATRVQGLHGHCGYEPTAVNTTFTSWKGFKATVEATLTGRL